MRVIIALLLAAFVLDVPLRADDLLVGTWVLDLSKSKFEPGTAPRSQTRVYRESGNGTICTVVTVERDGSSRTVEFPMNFDGEAQKVTGSETMDEIRMSQVTPLKSEATIKHAGQVVAKSERELVSPNELRVTFETLKYDGTPVRNVYVYVRK